MNLDFLTLLLLGFTRTLEPRTVTIPVSVNPNHPSQVVEEETIDNETVTTETYILSWSDNFTYRQITRIIQENTYKQFWDNASNYTWDNISIGNPDNMVTCDNSTLVNNGIYKILIIHLMNLGVYIVMVCIGLWVNVVGEMR